jgi:hypothetical protein
VCIRHARLPFADNAAILSCNGNHPACASGSAVTTTSGRSRGSETNGPAPATSVTRRTHPADCGTGESTSIGHVASRGLPPEGWQSRRGRPTVRSIVSRVLIAIVEDIAATAAATDLVRSDAMKSPTVDLVVPGDERAAIAAGLNAGRRGQRVLVVLRSGDGRVVGRLRRLCRAARGQLTVMTNAEDVCVDGVDAWRRLRLSV